jgi:predicted HicB family RNase H-like nuclease
MKKQATEKVKPVNDDVKATVRMSREVWSMARHAALDRGVSFGRLVEDALAAYLKVKP